MKLQSLSCHQVYKDPMIAIIFLNFLLEDNCFTILCWVLPYINMNQSQVYICPFRLEPLSHFSPHPTPLGCHRALCWSPCVTQQIPTGHLFYIWQCICFHATLNSSHPLLLLLCLYVYISSNWYSFKLILSHLLYFISVGNVPCYLFCSSL